MTFSAPRNAFFTIQTPNYGADRRIILPQDIKSISVVEEMGKSVSGSISLNDPSVMYDRALRLNAELLLSWGYKANGAPLDDIFGAGTADILTNKMERRGLSVLVLNPGGEGAQDGNSAFSCGFLSKGWFGSPKYTTYDSGTKLSVIKAALGRIGVASSATFVMFDQMNDSYNSESVERQAETDFQFVARLSFEWRCVFRIGHAQDGSLFAVFCSFKNIPQMQVTIAKALGVKWNSPSISWRSWDPGDLKCIKYGWKNQEGENGQGDNVQITYVNGVPTFRRFTLKADTIIVQTMDEEAVTRYVNEGHSIQPILNAKDFSDPVVQQFWSSATQTTAPNGIGYTVNVHMFGNPTITAGLTVGFNKGFPSVLRLSPAGAPIQFLIRKAIHSVSRSGYFTDLEVVDLLTVSAVGVF